MLEALKRFLSPEYLIVADPGPMGGLMVLYLALGLLFAAGLGFSVWELGGQGTDAQREVRQSWAWIELWICLAGLATVIGRFLGWPGWSRAHLAPDTGPAGYRRRAGHSLCRQGTPAVAGRPAPHAGPRAPRGCHGL